jgi:L-ribulose-5-phosphate 4-epimerase
MKNMTSNLRAQLIDAARILSHEELVRGFGHVSARLPGKDRFLLTPRVSLALVKPRQLLVFDLNGRVVSGDAVPPFETPLHAAIYRRKPEIQAITRIHARKANYFSVTETKIEPVHNHGSFFAGAVPVFHKTPLVSTLELGEEIADALGRSPAILLRGNGQVTVGRSVAEAVIMAIYLEEAADMLYGALQVGRPTFLREEESGLGKKETLPPVDLERAWNYYRNKAAANKRR